MFDLHVNRFNRFSAMHAFKAHEDSLSQAKLPLLEVSR